MTVLPDCPMTKREIALAVSEKLSITQLDAGRVVQNVLDAIKEILVEENRVELRNFGVLEVRERAARKARNPRTGDTVQVKKKSVVVFKAGKALGNAVQAKARKQKRK
jgi:nucleoid DNA-binding protein